MDNDKMLVFWQEIEAANTIAIGGHIRPDGDCVGSCMGLYNYLRENFPDKQVTVYLGEYDPAFHFLEGLSEAIACSTENLVKEVCEQAPVYDLFVALDSSNLERLEYAPIFHKARRTICVDHHITNEEYAMNNLVFVASSAAEAVYDLMAFRTFCSHELNLEYEVGAQFDEDDMVICDAEISHAVAECIYLGIIHDTGVFKHSNTTRHTMEVAGALVELGVDTSKLIDDTFYRKTYVQNQLLGQVLLESSITEDGKIISGVVTKEMFAIYQAGKTDLEGIVDQLRVTEGVEVAIFAYQTPTDEFKFSLRSNTSVDVSQVCLHFGGGGHVRASGCTIAKPYDEALALVKDEVYKQL